MRMQEMYYLCKSALDQWQNMRAEELKIGQTVHGYGINNVSEINMCLDILRPIDIFQEDILTYHSINRGLVSGSTTATLQSRELDEAKRILAHIKSQLVTICAVAESMGYEKSIDGLDVKFPDGLSFQEFIGMEEQLLKIFSQCPTIQSNDTSIKLNAVERGSLWLSFAVAGASFAAVMLALSKLVDNALIIRSHLATCKQQESKFRQMEASEELLTNMIHVHKETTRVLVNDLATTMADESSISDPESIERIRFSLNTLSDLMGRGVELYAAIGSSQEVTAAFPPVSAQRLGAEEIKLLANEAEGN